MDKERGLLRKSRGENKVDVNTRKKYKMSITPFFILGLKNQVLG